MLAACGRPASPPRPAGLDRDLAAYLLAPETGDPLARDAEPMAEARRLHSQLLVGSAAAVVESQARSLADTHPGFHPAAVVAGQAAAAGARLVEARALLRPVVAELPEYVAAQLTLGRVEELLGDRVAAAESYARAAPGSALGRRRSEELAPTAVASLLATVSDALARRDPAAAAAALARLERLAPEDRRTWEAVAETRRALGDLPGELVALRWLAPSAEGERRWVERRAEVELEAGDPSAAVALLDKLVRGYPAEPALAARLGAAKARWRLHLLPAPVVEITQRPELSRADLAVLIYWLIPEVRSTRPTAAAIATDVHEHPHRAEILRVINLGLMPIDESLHAFSPSRPTHREEALAALLRARALRRPLPSCLAEIGLLQGAAPAALTLGRGRTCAAAVACGWLREVADCLPSAPLSGPEFVAWASGAVPDGAGP